MKIRLQRFMADCGVASRRECEEIIAAGRVHVNGKVRTDVPVMIDPTRDKVTIDQELVEPIKEQAKAYYLLNKPKGVLVTNYDPADRKTAGELMKGVPERVFPVGRLEMDSRGALIMTNDGELANRLTHPRHGVEKTYIVEVEGRISPEGIEKIKRGMWLGPEHRGLMGAVKTDRFSVKVVGRERGRTILEVKISEGKNREIRRVMARIGNPVRDLNRVAIAGKVTIKGVDVGEFRRLSPSEVEWLYKASSPEYHEQQKNATQQWYEQKELEKERKRLAKEAEKGPSHKPRPKPTDYIGGAKPRPPVKRPLEKRVRPAAAPQKPTHTAHPLGPAAIRDDDF
jgi:23S rRNA pseudouridine2605 synthase